MATFYNYLHQQDSQVFYVQELIFTRRTPFKIQKIWNNY